MRHTKGTHLIGHVTLLVKGEQPELFFQKCLAYGIVVWNVKSLTKKSCQGDIKVQDIHVIRQVHRKTKYKLSFIDKKGYPFIVKRIMKKKELLLAFLISLLLVVFLSNILWNVTITGVSKEAEEKIHNQLSDYGIHIGSWLFNLDSPRIVQQKLTQDLPELLWIGVEQKGTTFHLEGVEKTVVKKKKISGPRHLIAAKKGVIQKVFVEKGQPKVRVNDVVNAGDLLVSGILNPQEDDDLEQDNDRKSEVVAAEGSIIAQTWYEVVVNVPMQLQEEILTGKQERAYYLGAGNFQVPLWTFGSSKYENVHQEMNEKSLYLFKWKLPIHIKESIISEKVYNKIDRTKEEAVKQGIIQAKRDLQLQLGPEAVILTENILHETIENGKVKLQLYITALEDISKTEAISQGD